MSRCDRIIRAGNEQRWRLMTAPCTVRSAPVRSMLLYQFSPREIRGPVFVPRHRDVGLVSHGGSGRRARPEENPVRSHEAHPSGCGVSQSDVKEAPQRERRIARELVLAGRS